MNKKYDKNNKTIEKNIETIEIHLKKIKKLLVPIQSLFPFTSEKMLQLTLIEEAFCESLIYRFMHVQDTLSGKIFSQLLDILKEQTEEFSFIDKLNLLEKLGIIENAYQWRNLRDLRNHFSHDYIDKPELQADFLNKLNQSIPVLMACLDKVKKRLPQNKYL